MFRKQYSTVTDGDTNWQGLKFPSGDTYGWEPDSTYIRKAPYFDGMAATPAPVRRHPRRARLPSPSSATPVTTDHISPAGSIKKGSPAGLYLTEHGVTPADFNSYGSRRGNHEVMVRGILRQRAPAQQTRARLSEGARHPSPSRRQRHVHLRRIRRLRRRARASLLWASSAGQEYRLRQLARLGRQGSQAARHPLRHRRKLRAQSIAPTSSAWASFRLSISPANPPPRSASPAKRSSPSATTPAPSSRCSIRNSPTAASSPCSPKTTAAKPPSSPPPCASTPRRRSSTTSTAASSPTSSVTASKGVESEEG